MTGPIINFRYSSFAGSRCATRSRGHLRSGSFCSHRYFNMRRRCPNSRPPSYYCNGRYGNRYTSLYP